jgi:Na+-driven multidrug efflux pump
MTKTFAAQATPIALAALLSTAMLLVTNALAGHQYRVAVAAHETAQLFASAQVQRVVVVAHRANV